MQIFRVFLNIIMKSASYNYHIFYKKKLIAIFPGKLFIYYFTTIPTRKSPFKKHRYHVGPAVHERNV